MRAQRFKLQAQQAVTAKLVKPQSQLRLHGPEL